MLILVAEFAVAENCKQYLAEGREMLKVLVESFARLGHQVIYPTATIRLEHGEGVPCQNLERALEKLTPQVDAGLVIAPDNLLATLTQTLEENTLNLGSPPNAIRKCADKETCTRILQRRGIPTPRIARKPEKNKKRYVIKPRQGCGSENTYLASSPRTGPGFIATEYIEGEHTSASLIIGKERTLPLTLNLQYLDFQDNKITYLGGRTPYLTPRFHEVMETASKAATTLGCQGYTGIDIVLADRAYVVDINPRPTTSITGISKILDTEIADLILKAKLNSLPENVQTQGTTVYLKNKFNP